MSMTKRVISITFASGVRWIWGCSVLKYSESDYFCDGKVLGLKEAVAYLNRVKRNRAVVLTGFFFRNRRSTPEARHIMAAVEAAESGTIESRSSRTKLIYLLLMAGY